MQSSAKTVEQYLAELPEQRQIAVSKIRAVILKNIPKGFVESMMYGMIGYYIPLERYPDTYNKQPLAIVALASQKHYMALYLMSIYGPGETEFKKKYLDTGKKLDMGKSCVRFRKLEDLPLDLIAEELGKLTPEQFIKQYENSRKN